MRPQLEDLTLNEILNANYEALKVTTASYLARLAAPDDAINARRIFHLIVEEIDDARHDFIVAIRTQGVEGEVVAE